MAYFRLPDNFSGSISDALRLMADYHEQNKSSEYKAAPMLDSTLSDTLGCTFDEFLDEVHNGKRLVGVVQLKDFDPKIEITQLQ